jgi:predicted anti-sigma-YlaC factor YlaD
MNHQPFDQWLLSDDPLLPEDQSVFEDHLNACQQCRDLQGAWLGVAELFQEVPEVEPAAGFSQRWMARLENEKQMDQVMRHRWQSLILLILFANVITGLVILLGTQFLTTFDTPLSLVMSGIYRLTSTVKMINAIQNISITLLRTIIGVVPTGLWALLGLGLVGSIATWIISILSLSALPRRS